jgi:hypothetical protein
MTIHYKKIEVRMKLFSGIVFFAIGTFWLMIAIYDSSSIYSYVTLIGITWLILSRLYFINYWHQIKNQYLTIEEGVIRQNWPFGKEMKLEEIKKIKNSNGKYLLQSEMQQMKIYLKSIDDQSLLDLNTELLKLDVQWSSM